MYHVVAKYRPTQAASEIFYTEERRYRNLGTFAEVVTVLEQIPKDFLDNIIIDRP